MKNFGGDDVGLLKVIPKETRQTFAGLSNAIADPFSDIGDRV